MIFRTSCVPRMKALLPLYSQVPKRSLWPAGILQHSTATQPLVCPNLPKLPVPKLENTIEKFLRSVQPLLTPAEFEKTRIKACQFAAPNGPGSPLQERLEDRAACMPNWLEDLWLEAAYLGYRDTVVINSSPSLMLPPQQFSNETDRLMYAAKLIKGALQFHRKVYRNEIPQQMVGNTPQDMTQFYRIFGTVRVPDVPIDKIAFADIDNQPRHICVVCNNNFYKLSVIDHNGDHLEDEQLLFMLHHVVECSQEVAPPVGVLTATDRDTWAAAYKTLTCPSLRSNKCSVAEIQSCLFLVCLDSPAPKIEDDRRTAICHQLLHGCGSHYNSGNRWFDKCIQFIIGAGGEVGLCYEHTPAEAIPVSMMVDDVLKYIAATEICPGPEVQCPRPVPLPFQVDHPIHCAIETAAKMVNRIVGDLDLYVLGFEAYGKDVPKSFKLSPDSYIQLAMQLAFYKIHHKPPPTYESASTRMFWGGRTETIRSCTNESKKFCELMADGCGSDEEKAKALRVAVEKHKDYTNNAMRGLGVDRHLLGLKLMAGSNPKNIPEFFNDHGYVYSKKFLISSSQVGAADECVMSYGPSEPDGYGVCYNPKSSKIIFSIASLRDCPKTSSTKYAKALEKSLLDMHYVLLHERPKRSKL